MRELKKLVVMLIVAGVCLLPTNVVCAADCNRVKEQCDGPFIGHADIVSHVLAQSFIPMQDFTLCKVSVLLAMEGAPRPVTLYVQNGPDADDYIYTQATVTITAHIPTWHDFDVPDYYWLREGQEYFIRLEVDSPWNDIWWAFEDGNPYPRGQAFVNGNTVVEDRDRRFKTYTYEPIRPEGKYYIKWSQPPVYLPWPGTPDQPAYVEYIDGWDEKSDYNGTLIVADDWLCEDDRPVTDIHWWGSFFGWDRYHPPPVVPTAFHIGIWTNVPKDPNNCGSFSHPGKMIWENYCDNWVWNFAGYDMDPRTFYPGEITADSMDSCFQFNQLLSQDEWFYQDPNGGSYEFLGGEDDDFAPPPEPASPSDELADYLEQNCPGVIYEFDVMPWNKCFGHTFSGLPPCIVAADLEIRLKASDYTDVCNDWIRLQLTGAAPGFEAFAWSRRIGTGGPYHWCEGPDGLLEEPWLSGSEHRFVFDLNALPLAEGQTMSIIDLLNRDHVLDICVHDDTGVDYAKLTVTRGNVYWLSIATIYDPNGPDPNYPWGWKTRERFFQDDAVRITGLTNADGTTWPPIPPTIGSMWNDMGGPIWWPTPEESWDLAFELSTVLPDPDLQPSQPSADLYPGGIVDSKDLAVMAQHWLEERAQP